MHTFRPFTTKKNVKMSVNKEQMVQLLIEVIIESFRPDSEISNQSVETSFSVLNSIFGEEGKSPEEIQNICTKLISRVNLERMFFKGLIEFNFEGKETVYQLTKLGENTKWARFLFPFYESVAKNGNSPDSSLIDRMTDINGAPLGKALKDMKPEDWIKLFNDTKNSEDDDGPEQTTT